MILIYINKIQFIKTSLSLFEEKKYLTKLELMKIENELEQTLKKIIETQDISEKEQISINQLHEIFTEKLEHICK